MLLTSTFVNTHALSHLFDQDEVSDIENCEFCDEYVVNHKQDFDFDFTPTYPKFEITEISKTVTLQFISTSVLFNSKPKGKFYNKPPPTLEV